MADNFTINTVTGQVTLRATDNAGVLTEHVIVESVAVADGGDVTMGATTDAAVTTDANGTVSAKLRGLVVLFVNFLSRLPAALGANGGLKVEGVANGTPVHVSLATAPALVAGTALIGNVGIDQATANANEVVVKSGTVTAVTAITNALPAGTNAIGKLAANSGVDIGDVDILSIAAGDNNIGNVDIASALPAGTNLVGKASVGNDTSAVYSGATALTPKFAVISGATSGNNTVVAAVADKKIRVLALFAVAITAVTVRFESAADGTALTGVMSIGATGGMVLPYNPVGWFETGSNALLNMELGGAVQVSGCLTYVEV